MLESSAMADEVNKTVRNETSLLGCFPNKSSFDLIVGKVEENEIS